MNDDGVARLRFDSTFKQIAVTLTAHSLECVRMVCVCMCLCERTDHTSILSAHSQTETELSVYRFVMIILYNFFSLLLFCFVGTRSWSLFCPRAYMVINGCLSVLICIRMQMAGIFVCISTYNRHIFDSKIFDFSLSFARNFLSLSSDERKGETNRFRKRLMKINFGRARNREEPTSNIIWQFSTLLD